MRRALFSYIGCIALLESFLVMQLSYCVVGQCPSAFIIVYYIRVVCLHMAHVRYAPCSGLIASVLTLSCHTRRRQYTCDEEAKRAMRLPIEAYIFDEVEHIVQLA
jgi:hypothetical protein